MNPTATLLAALPPIASDVAFVALTAAFFALAVAYAWFCEKVR
jgi:hypothetical protein